MSKLTFRSKIGANNVPSGTGAPFVVVLALLVVFYVIFLPPADREALLNNDVTPGTGGSSGSNNGGSGSYSNPTFGSATVFEQTFKGPGKLVREPRTDYAHDISTTTLRGAYQATVLLTANDFVVTRSAFASHAATFSFALDNPADVKNALLTFGVSNYATADGILTAVFNGVEVFSGRFSQFNSAPISLDAAPLREVNTLTLYVSAPGLAFWRTNEYDITGIKVQADVIARDGLEAQDVFTIDAVELQHLRTARLRFIPTCGPDSGKVTIMIGNQTVFSKIPDCGSANYITVPKESLELGQNVISFMADYGVYQLDRIQIQTFLDSDQGVSYFFDLNDKWFVTKNVKDPLCGESDGKCPAGCSQDVDRDCCFTSYEESYWCETPTQVTADRCVGYVDLITAGRCPSSYKDRSGDVADSFSDANVCGDNNDNVCPSGCSIYYDQDCCLTEGVGNYFCEQQTVGGLSNACKLSLATEEYGLCPNGYLQRDGGRLSTTYRFGSLAARESQIDSDYLATVEFIFVDDSRDHTAQLLINGDKTNIDTRSDRIIKDISNYVEADSNYIQIIPQTDFSLVRVTVKVEKR